MNEKVTVVIPARNEEKFIMKCLDSFVEQTYPKELFEVFVCDGRSTDNTAKIVNEYNEKYGNVQLVDNPGLSAPIGMNLGIKKSKADIIIIFGAHAYADKDFIKNNVEKFAISDEIGCVGGPIITINDDVMGNAIAKVMSSPFGVGNALFRYATKETYVDTVAFGAYKKSVFDKVGLFDEELVRNQDDELNYRVVEGGYKILLSPSIKSYYYGRSSLKKLWRQYYQYGFWKVRVLQKHGKPASIRHLVPITFVLTNILGIVLGMFFKPILILWLCEVALYAVCDMIFTVKLSGNDGKLLVRIPMLFPILHYSYGLGFLQGLMSFYLFKSKSVIEKNKKTSR